jgi:hypothetical protein
MAAAPVNQQRSTLLAAALFAAALVILALRSMKTSGEIATRPVPPSELQNLSAFLTPLPETLFAASGSTGPTVAMRDPFVSMGVAGVSRNQPSLGTSDVSNQPAERQWVVSTILVEGSKKSAIVNNAWVTIGDSLGGGSRLTAVERDHIVVTDAKGIRHKVPIQGGESW